MIAASELDGETEVFVVDNNSPDQTVQFLEAQFPSVEFIANQENIGFGRANNLAITKARGEFILFLNPDTILPENGLTDIIRFLEAQPEAGAAGIRMIDGSGNYLPESKRGFPGPWTSFCKMFGLTKAMPSSKTFAHYYMGHLDPEKNHQVEILAGAYMLVRKKTLATVGGFDEQFFMYAEDIDLSYRIQQHGFKNYYFSETPVIHFKGESTRKDARYVQLFYVAMIQFVRKHFRGSTSFFYRKFLETGIRLRSAFSMAAVNKPSQKHSTVSRLAFLTGDPTSVIEAKSILATHGLFQLTEHQEEAALVVYCIGQTFPASRAIKEMQLTQKQKMFHCVSSRSIVGSHSSDSNGEVIS